MTSSNFDFDELSEIVLSAKEKQRELENAIAEADLNLRTLKCYRENLETFINARKVKNGRKRDKKSQGKNEKV